MTCQHCQAPLLADSRFCGACGRTLSSTQEVSHAGQPSASTAEAPPLAGKEIAGRYRIREKLGEGGMGAVYKAEQISLKRTVAVKLLRPEVASSQLLLRRFNAEAEAVAKLSHPNTVNIYDFGQDTDGTLFIAMEFIEGSSLRQVIHKEAPLPLRRALHIASQIAASLTDAHAAAIVHRDLKPDNVMLQAKGKQRDMVRVLDFGIAKLRDERSTQHQMTQAGDMLGTPQYMAPEQIRAEAIDGRTDVYALGCMLYEMVTGRLPFEAPTVMALLSKHLLEPIVPPSQRRPDLGLSPAVDQLILSAMAKDPAHRPATMEMFGEQIAHLLATLPGAPEPSAQVAVPSGPPVFAPSSPPPPAPAPFVPTPSGYVPQAPGAAPYDPHANRAPAPPAPAPAKKSSNAALWAVLGVLLVGGTAAGIYVGASRKDDASVATPERPAQPTQPAAPGPSAGTVDHWGGSPSTPAAPLPPGVTMTSVQGISVKIPPGFTVAAQTSEAWAAADLSRGVAITVFAIPPGSDDISELARDYAAQSNLTVLDEDVTLVAGKLRPVLALEGNVGGQDAIQAVTALIGPTYRAGVIYHVQKSYLVKHPDLGSLGDDLLANGLFTP